MVATERTVSLPFYFPEELDKPSPGRRGKAALMILFRQRFHALGSPGSGKEGAGWTWFDNIGEEDMEHVSPTSRKGEGLPPWVILSPRFHILLHSEKYSTLWNLRPYLSPGIIPSFMDSFNNY